jgi:CAAX prenyl protease-like protein
MVSLMGIHHEHYPIVYSIKIGATLFTMLLCLPGYRKFPFRVSGLAFAVGAIGVVLWIVLCLPWVNANILAPLGLMSLESLGERAAYNPLEQLKDNPTWAYTFLFIRFLGLALVVPIIEEFFLRGFLMRFVMDADWWEIPFGHCNILALITGTAVPMLMHPGELLSSLVWFSMVTWLMLRTRNIWDCVAAHAVTNLLLGIYVVTFGQWYLW